LYDAPIADIENVQFRDDPGSITMTDNDQAAQTATVASAKDAWVKPEITSFVTAGEAEAAAPGVPTDAGPANLS